MIVRYVGDYYKVSLKGNIEHNLYDENGERLLDIHTSDHSNAKNHPFGQYGEHAHDCKIVNDKLKRGDARELTEAERKAHADIL